MNVFDFVNSASYNKKDLLAQGTHSPSDYVPFIINKAFSYFIDTVHHANEINKYPFLDNDQQYYFYLYAIRQARRFSGKWAKAVEDTDLDAVKTYYKLNSQKAQAALSILSREQLDLIKKKVQYGGIEQRNGTKSL